MPNTLSFLDKISAVLLQDFAEKMAQTVVVLPNKRAKIFLLEALKKQAKKTIFAPKIISIEDFIQDLAGIRPIDDIALLFEFYEVYLGITPKKKQQSFELFANWAKTILQDFNEIDRYLLEPKSILTYIKDIEDIKKWGVALEDKTPLLENYVDFWKLLPIYYHSLYQHLLQKKLGYQGLIYREAVAQTTDFCNKENNDFYVFAGFNALNQAEETIVQELLVAQKAKIYWDADLTFLNDTQHDAALFLRRFKEKWKHYKSNTFDWIHDDFAQSKNIQIIGTPKIIGQAKIVGRVIEKIIAENPEKSLDKVAVVLAEESALLPVLYALPASVGPLNITMGYSSKNNPAQLLIARIFKMHTAALQRKDYVFYYKDVLHVLNHPLVEPFAKAQKMVQTINTYNYTFIPHGTLEEVNPNATAFFKLIFEKWEDNAVKILQNTSDLLVRIKQNLSQETDEDKITKAFVYAIYKVINKLISYYSIYQNSNSVASLHVVYKQIIELAEVSFEGEPLSGLQIMGVLESRVLDFDTVIITSMNEGNFPAGKSQNSFIPYDVKREYGLPTFKEKDAIYTYHFYHLLQRAKNVYLLYNTESEGLDAGEKSRFITQLEVEKQPKHELKHEFFNAFLPENMATPICIPKSESVMQQLKTLAETGFSPTSLAAYIRNPIDFYFKQILKIKQTEEVEETVAANTLGTIIHGVLETLYTPFIDKCLTAADIEQALTLFEVEVLKQFEAIYKKGNLKKGQNLLAFEVAKRNVYNFLQMELANILAGDSVTILALEQNHTASLTNSKLPFPVLIKGNVDRIELRNGQIRIIDYKTGKVEPRNLKLKQWEGLTENIKNDKIIQLLSYAFITQETYKNLPIEVGIISFKNLKEGFMPFAFEADKVSTSLITHDITKLFLDEITNLLMKIFDENLDFEATE